MGSGIITPGQSRGVNGAEALQMIIQQLNQFATEVNLINLRLQVLQNIIISKNVATIPELETEWNKLMEEARSLAMKAKLVSPDGRPMMPTTAGEPTQEMVKTADELASADADAVVGSEKKGPSDMGHA